MERLGLRLGGASRAASRASIVASAPRASDRPGPYAERPAYDIVVQAMGGVMSLTGPPRRSTPTRVGTSIGDIAAGLFTAIGIQAALVDRSRTGLGMQVDVAMLDCPRSPCSRTRSRATRPPRRCRAPWAARHPSIAPFDGVRDTATASRHHRRGQRRPVRERSARDRSGDRRAGSRRTRFATNRAAASATSDALEDGARSRRWRRRHFRSTGSPPCSDAGRALRARSTTWPGRDSKTRRSTARNMVVSARRKRRKRRWRS